MTAPADRRRTAAEPEPYREPRGHWGVVALFLAAIAVALLLNGFADHTVGGAGTAPADTGASSGLSDSRPVLDLSRRPARALGMPARTVAVTFDDGPDPRWTPKVLAVLRRHHAHATFFMIGSRVAERPDLARRVLRAGHEIGSHTYTHVDIGGVARWRADLELGLTQSAISGATGKKVRLIRPPYSSVPSALQGRIERSVETAGHAGYLVVLADHDTEDWARPGTGRILSAAMPHGGAGAVVMMHDGGGDRSQTVAALDTLLTRLERQGYRATTLTGGLGLPRGDAPAPARDRVTGGALVTAQRVANWVAVALSILLVATAALITVRLIMLPVFAGAHARGARRRLRWHGAVAWSPPVSIVVPAYNEEVGIVPTIRSLVTTAYAGAVEVVVVDDGSTDRTADVAAGLGLPDVIVVKQRNGGKAAALNTGIAHAGHDVIILVDGDTIFVPETIGRLVAPLADPEVGAVAGSPRVGNRRKMLCRWQHLEYIMGANLDRRMFDVLRCVPTIPGAIGAFRRAALAAVGGISTDTLAEDTDLTMSLWRANWRVACEETALAWTEAPEALGQLWRQRYRWCYGTLQSMWKHKRALLQRGRAGRFGRRGLTHLALFQVALPLMSPVIDLFALFGLIFLNPLEVAGVWLAFLGAQGLGAAFALRLAGEPLRYLWSLPAQQILYRQLMYLAVIQSIVTALLGSRKRWHVNRRFGTFHEPAAAAAASRGRPER